MSRCGRTHQLEACSRGDLPGPVETDVRAHAKQCAVCRHELNWLETESTLFRQRAGRDEVAELWAENVRRRGGEPTVRRPWARVLVGMAAAAVLALVVGVGGPASSIRTNSAQLGEALETDALMSPALFFGEEETPCSKLPSGMGFQCAPLVPASFIASR